MKLLNKTYTNDEGITFYICKACNEAKEMTQAQMQASKEEASTLYGDAAQGNCYLLCDPCNAEFQERLLTKLYRL